MQKVNKLENKSIKQHQNDKENVDNHQLKKKKSKSYDYIDYSCEDYSVPNNKCAKIELKIHKIEEKRQKKSGKIQNGYADKTCENTIKKLLPYGN